MRSTIIVSVCLFLAVIAASIFYFTDLGKEHKDATKPLTYLPEETLLVIAFKNDETTDNIFKDFEVFDALMGFQQKQDIEHLKHKLLRNSKLNKHLLGTDLFISFHAVEKEVEALYTIPTIEPININVLSVLLSSLTKEYTVNKQDTLGQAIFTFTQSNPDSTFYANYSSDIFFVTRSKQLLTQVLDKSKPKLSQQQIDYFFDRTNRNVPLSIYYPHQQTKTIAQQFLRNKPGDFIQQFLGLGGQSTWNINYKQDALMLTGESELSEKANSYIALFANQSKTTQRLYNYYPANTAIYMEYSVSDLKKFRNELNVFLDKKEDNKRLHAQFETIRKDQPELLDNFESILGHEFSIIELNNQNYIGFVSIKDTTRFGEIVENFAESLADSLYRFRNTNLLYAYYGDVFKPFQRPFFTVIEDVMVISNYQSTLLEYTHSWARKDLLIGTLGFKNFERLQGNEANLTFFLQTRNASNTLLRLLNPKYTKNFRNKENFGYQDFYSWSAQLSGNGGNFTSSIYALYKSSTTLGASAEWTYQFNNRLITRPYIFEHSDTTQFILAQEQDHTIHAIHPNGKKMWSAVFHGRIVGDMVQLPDRSIVLVTDKNRLYRFDTEGKTLKGFSTGMPHEPSGTPSILSIDGSQVILIPASNKLMAYNMEGRQLTAWNTVSVEGKILDDMHASDDMIVVGSTHGRIYFFDQHGNKSKELDVPGDVEFKNQLGMFKKEGQDVFVTTDTSGTYYQMSYQKGIHPYKMADLSNNHHAFFENITGSDSPEMIIIDGSQLKVYDMSDSLQLLYNYNFTKDITNRPLFFPISRNQYNLGIASQATNLIYLFSDNGPLHDGFPIEALPLFYYGKINYNSNNYLLCTRRDHKLYAYRH